MGQRRGTRPRRWSEASFAAASCETPEKDARFACAACVNAVTPKGATLGVFAAGSVFIPSARRKRLLVTAWLPVAEAPCGS